MSDSDKSVENGSQQDKGSQVKPLVPAAQIKEGGIECVTYAGQRLLLVRVEGEVHAVSGTCPHEDVSLCQGALSGHHLRCPLHGSEFDVRTGAVLSDPAEQDLTRFDVVERDGWIVLEC